MEKSTGLSNYFKTKTVESKPENDSKPWTDREVNRLIFLANTSVRNTGDVDLEGIAKHFKRTEGAINVKLSKEGWFKEHGRGQNHQIRQGTLKEDILEYIKTHPYSFCRDIDNALGASTSSTLSTLIKEGKLKRIKHHGDGFYLYSLNEQNLPGSTFTKPNPTTIVKENILERIGNFLSRFSGGF
jgi:hypothetical protein